LLLACPCAHDATQNFVRPFSHMHYDNYCSRYHGLDAHNGNHNGINELKLDE
jgi:hypothetical protein